MSRQDANAAFALSSFLQGTNAAYIDDIYARYEKDPASVDVEWQEFFKSLKDTPADVIRNVEGPSWGRDNWPLTPRDELTSALDGNWATVEKAVGDKIATKAKAKGAEITAAELHIRADLGVVDAAEKNLEPELSGIKTNSSKARRPGAATTGSASRAKSSAS